MTPTNKEMKEPRVIKTPKGTAPIPDDATFTPPTNKHEEWEKEFDELLKLGGDVIDFEGDIRVSRHDPIGKLKSFIRSLLAAQKKELWEEIEGMKWASFSIEDDANEGFITRSAHKTGYNFALQAIQEKLRPPTVK